MTEDGEYDEGLAELQDEIEEDTSWIDFVLSPSYPARLTALAQSFVQSAELKVGDFVRWKPGLENRTFPFVDVVGVVVEVRNEPLHDLDDSSSRFFNEPLDVAIASLVGPDQEFAVYWYDCRRFEVIDTDRL